jgi:REP element-mobilizing transposase RayT
MLSGRLRSRGYLPHLEREGAIYFVTFRLADSLPESALREIRLDQKSTVKRERQSSIQMEEYLDKGTGACHLRQPFVANMVASGLRNFDGARYELFAWCIMPNHLHVVFQPFLNSDLAKIIHAWKSFTAHQANSLLSRTGIFWQREYYDHLIRDDQQLKRAIRYTAENPRKAGLEDWPYVFVSASAFRSHDEFDALHDR